MKLNLATSKDSLDPRPEPLAGPRNSVLVEGPRLEPLLWDEVLGFVTFVVRLFKSSCVVVSNAVLREHVLAIFYLSGPYVPQLFWNLCQGPHGPAGTGSAADPVLFDPWIWIWARFFRILNLHF